MLKVLKKLSNFLLSRGVNLAESSAQELIGTAKTTFKIYAYLGIAILASIFIAIIYGLYSLIF